MLFSFPSFYGSGSTYVTWGDPVEANGCVRNTNTSIQQRGSNLIEHMRTWICTSQSNIFLESGQRFPKVRFKDPYNFSFVSELIWDFCQTENI